MQQRSLIITSVLLMFIIVVPVFVALFWFAWKYRADNPHSEYDPHWRQSHLTELGWWLAPTSIVAILVIVMWPTAHKLDPRQPIASSNPPITIQVVALQWKWLFIYPEQNIATINFIQFPKDTPVKFELTADAPMNSFWIPSLGGQMYAMAGMRTQLNLAAANTGDFPGSAAEISGAGFAGMKFTARASTKSEFDTWVQSVKQSPETIFLAKYKKLAEPSENHAVQTFASVEPGLYDKIVMKFMSPSGMEH